MLHDIIIQALIVETTVLHKTLCMLLMLHEKKFAKQLKSTPHKYQA